MYRVVLYGLLVMVIYSFILSLAGALPFKPFELLLLLATLTFICYFGNILISKLLKSVINAESSLITALILYFLLWPSVEMHNVLLFAFTGFIAMASKFFIAYKKKHIFNPAAFAAVSLALFGTGALWWVGTPLMLPVTLVVGLLIVRKIRKFTLFLTFLGVTLAFFLIQTTIGNLNPINETVQFFSSFPVIFFGTIMLTEPLTMPPTRRLQMLYAALAGILFSWQGSFGAIILTTELVLLFGNIFSFLASPKYRLFLSLKNKLALARDTFEFTFPKPQNFNFKPGQYLEWTLPGLKTDGRGNRRYFTIASSPTEEFLKLGIKFNNPTSSFKRALREWASDGKIAAGQLMGDFVMPSDRNKKLVFIAGGIGVTPFRSMIKYLLDKNEKRDIVLFYANKTKDEIAYKELFDEAQKALNIKVIYILTEEQTVPQGITGEIKRLDESILKKHVPDYISRTFYLSGPNGMVEGYKKLLAKLSIKPSAIVTDYFPGF